MGLVLASHGSLLVTATPRPGPATNLMRALESNREIGVAMGILMQRHQITRDEAFDVLRAASQDSNRKLSAVASEVADTGILAVERRRSVPRPDAAPRSEHRSAQIPNASPLPLCPRRFRLLESAG